MSIATIALGCANSTDRVETFVKGASIKFWNMLAVVKSYVEWSQDRLVLRFRFFFARLLVCRRRGRWSEKNNVTCNGNLYKIKHRLSKRFYSQRARNARNHWDERGNGRRRNLLSLRRRSLGSVEWHKQRDTRGHTSDFLWNELDAAAKFLRVQRSAPKNINEVLAHNDRSKRHSGNKSQNV